MLDRPATHTLVIGVGNLLLSDEGVGVHAVRRLAEQFELPEGVQVLDGGTQGLDLLYHLEDVDNLLLVDAVEMGAEAGTLIRMEGEEIPAHLSVKMSPHQIGIPDMLFAAQLRDLYPHHVVVWGVQSGSLEVGMELSPPVAAILGQLVQAVVDELRNWGVAVHPAMGSPGTGAEQQRPAPPRQS